MQVILIDTWKKNPDQIIGLSDAILDLISSKSYGETQGQLEDLKEELQITKAALARLLRILIETKVISIQQMLSITNVSSWDRYQIKEIV